MKRGTNLKIQYSLKKTYIYRPFKLLNRSNAAFLKNNFNLFYFFRVFSFSLFNNLFFARLDLSKIMFSFYKLSGDSIFFPKNQNKKYYTNFYGKNYTCSYKHSLTKEKLYSNFFKVNNSKLIKKNVTYNNLSYWYNINISNYYYHINMFNTHIKDLINIKFTIKIRKTRHLIYIFLRKYKPINPSNRFKNFFIKLPFNKKIKLLSSSLQSRAGRNSSGRVTILSKGSRSKRRFIFLGGVLCWDKRLFFISKIFNYNKKIYSLQKHVDGSFSYSSLAHGSKVGQILFSTNLPPKFWYNFKPGSLVLLKYLKKYSIFFDLFWNNKCTYAKASGTFCQVKDINLDLGLCRVILPSGVIKISHTNIFVKLGRCSNIFNKKIIYGKAGLLNFLGKKPKNRGVARNPVDHPHGGNTKTNSPEVSPWGWVAKKNK